MANTHTFNVAFTTEPESLEAAASGEAVEYWNSGKWAGALMQWGMVQNSKAKLDTRLKAFLKDAPAAEKNAVEVSRSKVLQVLQDATSAHDKRYPKKEPGSERELVETVKSGMRAASETAWEYVQILDVMVGQAPEYVSLAYGAVKILLVVQVNYEEMKQNVEGYMDKIKTKFQMIDHLTTYLPTERLVAAIAKMYDFFNRFLAKALKFYTRGKIKHAFKSLVNPWKQLEPLVTSIEQTYLEVKDIVTFHGHVVGQMNLAVSQQILVGLQHLAHLFEQRPVKFSKASDVSEMADDCRQRVEARLEQPTKGGQELLEHDQEPKEDLEDFDALLEGVFVELQEYDESRSQQQRVLEQLPEMRPHRSKQRNILKLDRVMAWIESTKSELLWIDGNNLLRRHDFNASFTDPLLNLGQSNCERYLILRHFCGDSYSEPRTGYRTLIQALIRQIFKQRPDVWKSKAALLTRERAGDIHKLWGLFVECLREVQVECIFIVIDSIDYLDPKGSDSTGKNDGAIVLKQLNDLVEDPTIMIKVLLTAALAQEMQASAQGKSALIAYQSASQLGPRRKLSLDIMQNDFALVPHKLVEIQEKRANTIKFAELPMLYPANSTIYTREDGRFRAYVVAELTGMDPGPFGQYGQLQIKAWSIDHNGKYFTKRYHNLTVSQFAGEKGITSLKYVPAGYLPNEVSIRSDLIKRGKNYWKWGSEICYMQYTSEKKTSRIVIDQSFRTLETVPPAQEFEDQFPETEASHLKPLILLICSPVLSVYVPRDLRWATVDIDEIEPIEFEVNILRKLVLAEDQEEILLSAMKSIGSEKNEWGRSYDSQEPTIILLHGGPGSGKTVTTKYVAEHFQRPLISFSAGALGQTPSTVDANLHFFLECAERWRAVLVMENADVILEQRVMGDMVHNSVVMTFQRALENYTGVIILTTTRVGALDESIEARIQVAIEYLDLRRKGRRRIWKDIIEEASKSHRVNTRDLMNHLPDLVDKPMNGKEILSAFKIAMQSVEDGDKLEWDHLAKSFRLAENFKSYLNEVRGATGARHAAMKKERAPVDETRGTIGKRENKDSDEQGKSSSEDETDEEKDISVS